MAATKYQVFYRYGNPNSNQLLTNDSDSDYEQVFEMYHEGHKLLMGTPEEQLEASEEKSKLIIDGNNTSNDNYQMLFKFTGTKRINKKVWKDKSIGYVISNDWKLTIDKKLITRAVDGDYSGSFLLVEGDTIENGLIIARKNPVTSNIYTSNTESTNKKYFENESEVIKKLQLKTIAKLKSVNYTPVTKKEKQYYAQGDYWNPMYYFPRSEITTIVGKENYNLVETATVPYYKRGSDSIGGYVKGFSAMPEQGCYVDAYVAPKDVETYEIPAHYEEDSDYPYIIRDTYKRIEQSPWFLLSTHSSLQSALEKAKGVVNAIGLENVKVIKVVPTEQFVRIN